MSPLNKQLQFNHKYNNDVFLMRKKWDLMIKQLLINWGNVHNKGLLLESISIVCPSHVSRTKVQQQNILRAKQELGNKLGTHKV